MLAEFAKVGVAGEPFEVAVTQSERLFERSGGGFKFAIQGVAAGQIVKNQRIARLKAGQFLVHFKTELESAALGVMIAKDLKGLDISWIAPDYALHEGDFDVQIANLFTAQPFALGTAFFGHTTLEF